MDVKVDYQALEGAIAALSPTYIAFVGCTQDIESVQSDIESGIWTGETADHFIERLNADLKLVNAYIALLGEFDAALRKTVQTLKEADAKAKQSIPSV